MLRRRLNYLNFSVRLITLLLPALAFAVAGYIRFLSGIIPPGPGEVEPAAYFGLLSFATLVWAFAVGYYGLALLDLVFAVINSLRQPLRACGVSYLTVCAATLFYTS